MLKRCKPCPFCGSTRIGLWYAAEYEGVIQAFCESCGADGPSADSSDEAQDAWNKRIIRKSKEKMENEDSKPDSGSS